MYWKTYTSIGELVSWTQTTCHFRVGDHFFVTSTRTISMESAVSQQGRPCPFCSRHFKRLGNHLPSCHERDGRDYSSYLSHKTLHKRITTKKQLCPSCGKGMKRLDTHLRVSARCKQWASGGLCNSESGPAIPSTISTTLHSLFIPILHSHLKTALALIHFK